jgi:hypothetical protein
LLLKIDFEDGFEDGFNKEVLDNQVKTDPVQETLSNFENAFAIDFSKIISSPKTIFQKQSCFLSCIKSSFDRSDSTVQGQMTSFITDRFFSTLCKLI